MIIAYFMYKKNFPYWLNSYELIGERNTFSSHE